MKMKVVWKVSLHLCVLSMCLASVSAKETLKTEKDKTSYGIGVDVGTNFRRLGLDLQVDKVMQGLKDGYLDKKLDITEEELKRVMVDFQRNLQDKQARVTRELADTNRKKGEAFLEQNARREGVTVLPSGLQYRVLIEGHGPMPQDGDNVSCHYTGALIDGKVFDKTDWAANPRSFNIGQVIPGWAEALKLMKVGSKWEVTVPPQLAYGSRGVGRDIGPNEVLVFEIELLNIMPKESSSGEAGQSPSRAQQATPAIQP